MLQDIEVSEVGMGCMAFSHGYGKIPAEEYSIEGTTPAQISLAWMLHKYPNVVPIPGSKNKERIIENLDASDKKSGRKEGQLDKMTPELQEDIEKFLSDRSIKQVDLMNKYHISRNTLKKYIGYIANENCI